MHLTTVVKKIIWANTSIRFTRCEQNKHILGGLAEEASSTFNLFGAHRWRVGVIYGELYTYWVLDVFARRWHLPFWRRVVCVRDEKKKYVAAGCFASWFLRVYSNAYARATFWEIGFPLA